MSFESKKIEFGREKFHVIEIDLDTCSLDQGIAPCTASLPSVTGDTSCFNTITTCLDLPNFDDNLATQTTRTYRFCSQRSPHPIGLDAIPSILSVSNSPAKIDLKGGLGVRSSLSVSFQDHPSSDIDIDQNLSDRTYIASERGTYWTKLRARTPNYQFREIRHLSGYLNSDGSYDASNFQTRYYVIDQMDVTGGRATITAKDPLKLAASKKAQAPTPSTGLLTGSLTAVATSATLTPVGVGNLEYAASGKVLINKEVMSFTRAADVLTLTRAQNNTTATTHAANDTVQECLEYNEKVNGIVEDLLVNYSNIDATFIDSTAWESEADTNLSYLLDGIIVKPMDVNKLLKELSQASPHYLWWDERNKKIQFTALKAPPTSSSVLNMTDNIIADSVSVKDNPEMRVSTVFVNFGQFNPVEKLDEIGNYQQSYARIDSDSIVAYGSSEIEVINSRWINNANRAGAIRLAQLIGRRFANTPRSINFSLDDKDSDGSSGLWAGQTVSLNHRDMTDFTGSPEDTLFQITSAKESTGYQFSGLEFKYGESLPDDIADTSEVVYLSVNETDVNLYDKFDSVYGTPDASTEAKFVVRNNAIIGSTTTGAAMDLGDWSLIPAGFTICIQINSGSYVIGKGGDGQHATGLPAATNGGLALNLTENCEIINNGIIGGGGGGGGNDSVSDGDAGGGGGAGSVVGIAGAGTNYDGEGTLNIFTNPENGTTEIGGTGGAIAAVSPETFAFGGKGGDLGDDGVTGGGTAGTGGNAIDENGNTITYTTSGDIRGATV